MIDLAKLRELLAKLWPSKYGVDDRDSVIEVFRQSDDEVVLKTLHGEYAFAAAELLNAAAELIAAAEQARWVPTSERLPTKQDADRFDGVQILYLNGDSRVVPWDCVVSRGHTHWRKITPPEVPPCSK